MEASQGSNENLKGLSFEELDAKRALGNEETDYRMIQAVLEEARSRDGMDDTDPNYYHLAQQCIKDINNLVVYYG